VSLSVKSSNTAQNEILKQAVGMAFASQDGEKLRELLAQNPGLWKSHVAILGKSGPSTSYGPMALHAIDIKWHRALDILKQAGDQFDQAHSRSGQSALSHAMHKCNIVAVRKLLALGVPIEGFPGQGSPIGSIISKGHELKKKMGVVQVMLDGGANPWAITAVNKHELTLPEACLVWGQAELATQLIKAGPPPQSIIDEPMELWERWKESMIKEGSPTHLVLLEALIEKSLAPPISVMASWLEASSDRRPNYGPCRESQRDVLISVIKQKQVIDGRDEVIEEGTLAILRQYPDMEEACARYEQSMLEQKTQIAGNGRICGLRL
jgi:hypothetical protein